MYSDYEVVYKSNLNEYLILWIILGTAAVLLLLFTVFSASKVFKKANRSGIAAWIPFYNLYLLVEIANLSKGYFLLSLIPIINLYAFYVIDMKIAKLFKKDNSFGYGLFFLPFIFYPILAFSDSEYIGINIVAMEGSTTVEDIPVIDDIKQKEITVEENSNIDMASRNINISIGGGKYQKDYVSNLTDVDKTKVLNKAQVELEDKRKSTGMFINNERFEEIANKNAMLEEKKEPSDLFSVPFINQEEVKQPEVNVVNNSNPTNNVVENSNKTQPAPTQQRLCPNCGTRVGDSAKICFVCGQPLE